MCKVPVKLRELVKQRLAAAAEEIFELLERTITEYEEELIWKYDRQKELDKTYSEEVEEVLYTTHVSMKDEEEEDPETWTEPVHHNQTVSCPESPVPVSAPGDHLLHLNDTEETRGTDGFTLEDEIKTEPLFIDEPQEGDTTPDETHLRSLYSKKMHPLRCVCLKCGKAFPWKSKLERHMQVHNIKKTFSCSVCGKKASSKWHLQTHMKTHVGSTVVDCEETEKNEDTVKNEPLITTNDSENETKTGTVPDGSNGHLSQNKISPNSEKRNLRRIRHRRNFGSRKLGENSHSNLKHKGICHNCPVCSKAFKWRSNLERHIRVHTGEKPFSCPVCDKRFSRQYHVRSHMDIHTRDESFGETDSLKTTDHHLSSDQNIADDFGEGSSSDHQPDDATVQQNTPESVKKLKGIAKCHKCLFCEKLFSKKCLMERHLRVHTGEKPYSCPICGKRFTRQDHVRSHMNIHSPDKPYSRSVPDQTTEGGSLIYCSIDD